MIEFKGNCCGRGCDDCEEWKAINKLPPYSDVDNPSHYTEGRKYEPIDVIEDWQLDFHLGNALKYIARAGRKDSMKQDIEKAIWYLKRFIKE